jgi:hypothetical protein
VASVFVVFFSAKQLNMCAIHTWVLLKTDLEQIEGSLFNCLSLPIENNFDIYDPDVIYGELKI